MSRVFALSIHADYRCRHSGVCCSSDWDVPVEVPVYRNLETALASGRLPVHNPPFDGGAALIEDDDLPDGAGAMVSRSATGHCVFYHRDSSLCAIHRDLGHEHLPVTCQHFPRLAVRDRRGTHISLSHYCPTAASLLFRERAISVVPDPVAFPPAEYEGLVIADADWPPLLHERMLMDLDSYSAWERHMVARCADSSSSPEDVIVALLRDAETLEDLDPERERLVDRIDALAGVAPVRVRPPDDLAASLGHFRDVMSAVPDEFRPAPDEEGLAAAYSQLVRPAWSEWAPVLRRYVAAKAFANWTAYQGRGLRAVVVGLEAALGLVRVEASRQCRNSRRRLGEEELREGLRAADFLLNHLAVGEDLAAVWSARGRRERS